MKVTLIENIHDPRGVEQNLSLEEMAEIIRSGPVGPKQTLPLFKLGKFGHTPNQRGNYRTASNVGIVSGVELDYDGEEVSFEDVCATLRDANVKSLAYTSPSYTIEKPRWRVLFPLSREIPPKERRRWCDAADALIGELAGRESWDAARCYYYGNNAQVELFDGIELDRMPRRTRRYESWLESIGDHDGGAGFHAPVKAAIATYIAANKNATGLLDEMKRVIYAADYSKHNAAYREVTVAQAAKLIEWTLARQDEHGDFDTDKNGKPYPNQANALIAFDREHMKFSYDEFSDVMSVETPTGLGRLDDPLITQIRLEIDREYGFLLNKDLFYDIVTNECRKNIIHPVRNYLDSLSWDGEERLPGWLIRHAGVEDNEYSQTVFELQLIAAVRRVRLPACKKDEMLVFVDPTEGTGKSAFFESLCPNREWFYDDLDVGAESKIVLEKTGGKWIIECAELKGRKGEVERIKTFMTQEYDKARMAYGRMSIEKPRQFVMFGTTNQLQFLEAEKNRRFWPVTTQGIIQPLSADDRDQLWAEAAYKEAQNRSHTLPEYLWELAAAFQEQHRIGDLWEDYIEAALENTPTGKVRIVDLCRVLGIEGAARTRGGDKARLITAMNVLGWQKERLSWGTAAIKQQCFWKEDRLTKIVAEESDIKLGMYVLRYEDERELTYPEGGGF